MSAENNSSLSQPKLEKWSPPLQVEDILEKQDSSQQLPTYLMSHLLAAGFRGSEYQLLVLLSQLTQLMIDHEGKNFEAVFEIKNHGNLDDIGIIIKEDDIVLSVDTYQVKYYKDPISAQAFFNKKQNMVPDVQDDLEDDAISINSQNNDNEVEDEHDEEENEDRVRGKNVKMHIGKFFKGWLSWKKKYPDLPDKFLRSIVFSNAPLDEILSKCVEENIFSPGFVSHEQVVYFATKSKLKVKVPFGFLTKVKGLKISRDISKKIWEKLKEDGIINEEKYLIGKLNFESLQIKLPKNTPKQITADVVKNRLKEICDQWQENQQDLWDILYQQAWQYLIINNFHKDETSADEAQKKKRFGQFLRSFHFQINQDKINALESKILKNLVVLTNQPPDQVFLCLSYALREWFRREYVDKRVPILTDSIMKDLLKEALTRSRDVVLLQGRSEAVISRISYLCADRSVSRDELIELQGCLKEGGLVSVIGQKGMGKSGLIKQALQGYHSSEYLFVSTSEILQEVNLRNKIFDVLQHLKGIRIIVLDAAESLLDLSENEVKNLFSKLQISDQTVILSITPEARHIIFKKSNSQSIILHPLKLTDVLNTFPELSIYKEVHSLMQLATIPFYLSVIIRLIKQIGTNQFEHLVRSKNIALEAELVKLVVEGREESGTVFPRQLAWQHLALRCASSQIGESKSNSSELAVSSGLSLLIREGIVQEITTQKKKSYRFRHDLFFEHGLMSFLLQKWGIAVVKGKTHSFWEKLSQYFKSYQLRLIIEKWFTLHGSRLKDDLLENIETISNAVYFNSIVGISIIAKLDILLSVLLDSEKVKLNAALENITGHYSSTYVLLAIWYDNPSALQMLLSYGANPHHPFAGTLISGTSHSYYERRKPKKHKQSDESSSESGSDDEKANNSSSSDSGSNNDEESNNSSSSDSESSSSHSGYNLGDEHSDSSNEGDNQTPENESVESILEKLKNEFIGEREKYWTAGFDEEPDFLDEYSGELIANPRFEPRPNYSFLYIFQAVLNDRGDCLEVLLDQYDERNERQAINLNNSCKETPLHISIITGAHSCTEILLRCGASVYARDKWGETPLHNAAYEDDVKAAAHLLEEGANPNAENEAGLTPYHIAIARLDLAIVKLLFSYGGDLSIRAFGQVGDGLSIGDLLEAVWERFDKNEVEEFVLELVKLLNYGRDNGDFKWAENCEQIDLKIRKAQLDQMQDIFALVKSRAQLSMHSTGLDYWDDESELNYAIKQGDKKRLNGLMEYILSDLNNIAKVLKAKVFLESKSEIINKWFESGDLKNSDYYNLKKYAAKYDDADLLKRVNEDLSLQYADDELSSSLDEQNKSPSSISKAHLQTDSKDKKPYPNSESKSSADSSRKASHNIFSIRDLAQSQIMLFGTRKNTLDKQKEWTNFNKTIGIEGILNQQEFNLIQIKQLKEGDPRINQLQEENKTLELLLHEKLSQQVKSEVKNKTKNNEIKVDVNGAQLSFVKHYTSGDGWCTFYAAGLDNPVDCLNELIERSQNIIVRQDLAYNILQNYITSLPVAGGDANQQVLLREQFHIGEAFKKNITALYKQWKEADVDSTEDAYKELMTYLCQTPTVLSYLNHLLKNKYASFAVVKTYMTHVLNKQVGIIIKYGTNYYADIPQSDEREIRYVLYDPSQRMELAHYSRLERHVENNLQAALSNSVSLSNP